MTVPDPNCGTCRFANVEMGDDEPVFQCRRFPPQIGGVVESEQALGQSWPTVYIEDWCGEHQPRSDP